MSLAAPTVHAKCVRPPWTGRSECVGDILTPQRCKSGGHECIFEESNRGKRSTRKNEALAAKIAKMEAALKGIGGVSHA